MRAGHHLDECPDIYVDPTTQKSKRRQRACKVCSLLQEERGAKRKTTKYFCDACSEDDKRSVLTPWA